MTCQILFLGAPLLPAAVAHGLCIRFDWLRRFKRPIDFGRTYRGTRIFGDHKTWRAPLVYGIFCPLGTLTQGWLQGRGVLPPWLLLLDYERHGLLAGILLALGMAAGELPNSFLKRRLGIAPGKRKGGMTGVALFLLDQVDLAFGIWIGLFLLVRPSLALVAWSFLLTLVLHVAVSMVGYLLDMRETLV